MWRGGVEGVVVGGGGGGGGWRVCLGTCVRVFICLPYIHSRNDDNCVLALVSLSMKPGTYSSLLRFNHGEENEGKRLII